MSEPLFAFAVPHRAGLPADLVRSILGMTKPHRFVWFDHEGSPPDAARNQMTRDILRAPDEIEAVLFIDDDMLLSPSTLGRLYKTMKETGAEVVSALYFGRTEQAIPMAYRLYDVNEKGHHYYKPIGAEVAAFLKVTRAALPPEDPALMEEWNASTALAFEGDATVEVDGVGFGCVLIKTSLLRRMEPPWFAGDPLTGGGEDFYFCRQAKAAGATILVNLSVHAGHYARGSYIGRLDFADVWAVGMEGEFDWTKDITEVELLSDAWGRVRVAGAERQDVVAFGAKP